MMWPQDGPVPSEVIKVVHDDSHKEIDDEEGTKDVEGDEVRACLQHKLSMNCSLSAMIKPHLEGLEESPEQSADALPSAEQFHQPHDSEEAEEVDAEASSSSVSMPSPLHHRLALVLHLNSPVLPTFTFPTTMSIRLPRTIMKSKQFQASPNATSSLELTMAERCQCISTDGCLQRSESWRFFHAAKKTKVGFLNAKPISIKLSTNQKCAMYSVGRRTKRWPLYLFLKILDVVAINSAVIYKAVKQDSGMARKDFIKQLAL
ncbi:hypothetical protein LAZ67_17000536 [Cordylochernes scorpioides]|uniref:PiggyBac transposable element-derived protein domain-containing protein n=1 Tax=Cordylochernes scorpioides TaxID=51811 RepID=A0ABY6LHK4_9ARAC|nr:hypothetical protein LAZ67_17000536 [Cordylochernes scorpioides]